MNTIVKVAFLHFMFLSSQAVYMYVSNTAQLKSRRLLYIIWMPFVIGLPAVLYYQYPDAYYLYEYAIVTCMITAAIADAACAAAMNREYLTDSTARRFLYSYLLICVLSAFLGGAGNWIKVITALLLIETFFVSHSLRKYPISEFLRSVPLALLSIVCALLL